MWASLGAPGRITTERIDMRAAWGAFAVSLCLLAGEQESARAGDTLEHVTMNVSVNGIGGEPVISEDGVIQRYPRDGGVMHLTLGGLLNGHQESVQLTGKLIRLLHDVSIFRTPIGLDVEYYVDPDITDGFVTLCFVDDRIYTARSTGNQSSDAFLKAWAGQQFAENWQKIWAAGDQARNGDSHAMAYLGLIVHPDAERELLILQNASDANVAAAAKKALAISNELRSVVGSR